MPYSIRMPDGTVIQNIPDELTPEQAKLKILADKRFEKFTPKSTLWEDAKDLGASLTSGASSLAGLANDAGLLLGIGF